MVNEWFKRDYFMYLMIGVCGVGLITKIVVNAVYLRLLHASGNMGTSKNKLVQNMKLKFETFYKLKIGVNNVDIFVDKYVYKYRFCGLLLSTWENFSGLMLVLCLILGPILAILGLILNCGQTAILYTFFVSICTSAILVLVDNLFSIQSKKKIVKLNMKDYLENFLQARLIQEAEHPELFEQYRAEVGADIHISNRELKKQEKRLEKEKKEREKLLLLEEKQREREEKKRDKIEQKQAQIARKEIERMRLEEEQKEIAAKKAEAKRQLLVAKEQKKEEQRKREEILAEKLREEAEKKAAQKRIESAAKAEKERQDKIGEKLRKEQELLLQNQKISDEIREGQVIEIAASKEARKKKASKQERVRESVASLKEEVQAQRELRNKERSQGKDPYNVFQETKKPSDASEYHVNDFDMEQEMKLAAKKREDARVEKETIESSDKVQEGLVGRSPYENKVINDFLKEFFA